MRSVLTLPRKLNENHLKTNADIGIESSALDLLGQRRRSEGAVRQELPMELDAAIN
jgi:hypothetical protein